MVVELENIRTQPCQVQKTGSLSVDIDKLGGGKNQNGHGQQIFRPGYEQTLANLEMYLKIVVISRLGLGDVLQNEIKCGPAWPEVRAK